MLIFFIVDTFYVYAYMYGEILQICVHDAFNLKLNLGVHYIGIWSNQYILE